MKNYIILICIKNTKIQIFFSLKLLADLKPYNLTYFIRLYAVATFEDHKTVPFNRKPYKIYFDTQYIIE